MNKNFFHILKNENSSQDERIATNFRMTQTDFNTMGALADEFNITKQELFDSLIKNYVLPAYEEARQNNPQNEQDCGHSSTRQIFLLNTNNTHSIHDIDYMLQRDINGKILSARATLFEKGYIDKINYIHEGDIVCLFESGKGIIGFGIAYGKPIDEQEPKKYNHNLIRSINLKNFKEFAKPITAKRLRVILETNPPFLHAMSSLNGNLSKLESELNNQNERTYK